MGNVRSKPPPNVKKWKEDTPTFHGSPLARQILPIVQVDVLTDLSCTRPQVALRAKGLVAVRRADCGFLAVAAYRFGLVDTSLQKRSTHDPDGDCNFAAPKLAPPHKQNRC
ncbi:unnamed protein product [Ceratitis capitata]|uniref:(Mediterranean fruit fly) hypothetical protein n=1 Tax=Ceratitis capitata TaxID=7213 RepID=A0A811V5T5_CERCA|nr:unnamed protein product [Ceratitis capitata]